MIWHGPLFVKEADGSFTKLIDDTTLTGFYDGEVIALIEAIENWLNNEDISNQRHSS